MIRFRQFLGMVGHALKRPQWVDTRPAVPGARILAASGWAVDRQLYSKAWKTDSESLHSFVT